MKFLFLLFFVLNESQELSSNCHLLFIEKTTLCFSFVNVIIILLVLGVRTHAYSILSLVGSS